MSFGSGLFAKFGLPEGMSSLLPQYTSPPRSRTGEHSLYELSPRPDHDPLPPGSVSVSEKNGSKATRSSAQFSGPSNGVASAQASNKGKGKAKASAVSNHGSPYRSSNSEEGYERGNGVDETREKIRTGQTSRRSPPPSPPRDWNIPNAGPALTFMESMFMPRPKERSGRHHVGKVDKSFQMIMHREKQIERQLQKMLQAQERALDAEFADGDQTPRVDGGQPLSVLSSLTSDASSVALTDAETYVPVRQPKTDPIKAPQARSGISNGMTQLADLKNEEEAYIATALAERKAALSRLRNLDHKRKSIITEIKAIESDRHRPIKNEIAKMEDRYRSVCHEIDQLEDRLKRLKEVKGNLMHKIEAIKSTKEADLSGYKGALKECDNGVWEILKYPGIQVLEVDELVESSQVFLEIVSGHLTGFEFFALKPERRTLQMAKDWWEGEIKLLDQRKLNVNRERQALEQGSEIWRQTVQAVNEYNRRFREAIGALNDGTYQQHDPKRRTPKNILLREYKLAKSLLKTMEKHYDFAEQEGYTLLVAAIGAELEHFRRTMRTFADVLHDMCAADGSVTPPEGWPSPSPSVGGGIEGQALVDVDTSAEVSLLKKTGRDHEDEEDHDELTGSVVRRWGGETSEPRHSPDDDQAPVNLLTRDNKDDTGIVKSHVEATVSHHHEEESDNEVPPGLISEPHDHESEDDNHDSNEVPPEFLSMHSSQPAPAPSAA
ncbi:hypothetical protein F4778DRAFT_328784 [Xylariomycetidae sp. FL2044]|nr:hypothetical protein F4778DRAFT_328784 [Xylariomycetidae sp. FL2044]